MNRIRGPFEATGTVLRELRREYRLRPDELADRCGIPESTLGAFEAGDREPTLDELGCILEALGVSARELGWRLDRARRAAEGRPSPPEDFQGIVETLTETVAAALWLHTRPEADPTAPPEHLLAKARKAGEGLVGVLWEVFEPMAAGSDAEEDDP